MHGVHRQYGQWLSPRSSGHRGLCLYPFGCRYTVQQAHLHKITCKCTHVFYCTITMVCSLELFLCCRFLWSFYPVLGRDGSLEDADGLSQIAATGSQIFVEEF